MAQKFYVFMWLHNLGAQKIRYLLITHSSTNSNIEFQDICVYVNYVLAYMLIYLKS